MQVLRTAGYNERRCIAREGFGLYGSIVFIATYTSSKASIELQKDITLALQRCADKLEVLRAVILDAATERPRIGVLPTIDVRDHLTVFTDATTDTGLTVQQLLESEHNVPHLECHARPQWRVSVCFPSSDSASSGSTFRLAWISSHNLADGMSGLAFHSVFLQALRDVRGSMDTIVESPIPPPLDLAAKWPISWTFLLAPFLTVYLPFLARMLGVSSVVDGEAWMGASVRPTKPKPLELLQTDVRMMSVPHENIEELSVRCRIEQVRLTGLFGLLASRAVAQALRERGQTYDKFVVDVAINMRRALKQSHGCIANYPSGVSDTYDVRLSSDGSLPKLTAEDWTAARKATEHLFQASSTLSDQPVALLGYLTNIRSWVLSQAAKSADSSLEVSNLGVFDDRRGSKEDEWRIEDVIFSQSADAMRAPLSLNVCSSKQGPLNIVATWWPGMLGVKDEEAFVEQILESIQVQIRDIIAV